MKAREISPNDHEMLKIEHIKIQPACSSSKSDKLQGDFFEMGNPWKQTENFKEMKITYFLQLKFIFNYFVIILSDCSPSLNDIGIELLDFYDIQPKSRYRYILDKIRLY